MGEGDVDKLCYLLRIDGVDLGVSLLLNGGGGVLALVVARHAHDGDFVVGGRIDLGHGIALIRGHPAAVDQEGLTGFGFKGDQ